MRNPSSPIAQAPQRELHERIAALQAAKAARLDDEEVAALAATLSDVTGEVWLFGSRVESGRRGGDIDVLILTGEPAFETSRKVATRFYSLCEEKIDVVVFNPERLTTEQADFLSRIHKVRLV